MYKKKKKANKIKILIVLILLFVVVKIIGYTFAILESNSKSTAYLDMAVYVLNEDYQEMNLNLGKLLPRDDPYVYTFSISNNDGTQRTETNMQYDLKLRTTTNLPITIELYENENYQNSGSQDIISSSETKPDEHGTYFTTYTTETSYFRISKK